MIKYVVTWDHLSAIQLGKAVLETWNIDVKLLIALHSGCGSREHPW